MPFKIDKNNKSKNEHQIKKRRRINWKRKEKYEYYSLIKRDRKKLYRSRFINMYKLINHAMLQKYNLTLLDILQLYIKDIPSKGHFEISNPKAIQEQKHYN